MTSTDLMPAALLARKAIVYVRQSTQSQVMTNLESQRRQYDLVDVARQRGCIGAYLDTFGFQAPNFYPKHGYEIFGTIEDHPRGSRRVFFKKQL